MMKMASNELKGYFLCIVNGLRGYHAVCGQGSVSAMDPRTLRDLLTDLGIV